MYLNCQLCVRITFVLLVCFTMTTNLSEGVVNLNTSMTGLDRLIQNHRALCRLSDSCAAIDTTDPMRSCCMPCSCEASCFSERTCCPEVLSEFWKEPDTEITQAECLKPVFARHLEKRKLKRVYRSKKSANMIAKCPKYFENIEIKETCEQRNGTALEEHIPVTDTNTNFTFTNKYCAECHHIPVDHLAKWLVSVECFLSVFNFRSIDSLLADVGENNDCYLDFKPLVPHHHVKCVNMISSCNVTGEWREYDNFTARACQLFKAPYREYRNPFCAICNGVDANEIAVDINDGDDCVGDKRNPPAFVRFSALISMDPEENFDTSVRGARKNHLRKSERCSENQIYDAYTGICRDITCGAGQVLKAGRCISAFNETRGICYKVFLKITPSEKMTNDVESEDVQLQAAATQPDYSEPPDFTTQSEHPAPYLQTRPCNHTSQGRQSPLNNQSAQGSLPTTSYPTPTDDHSPPDFTMPSGNSSPLGYSAPINQTFSPSPLDYHSPRTTGVSSNGPIFESQTQTLKRVLIKRSSENELSELYFYARELSYAIGNGITKLFDNLHMENYFKVVIFNASESKDNMVTSGISFAEVSIFGKDYVHTDSLVDGILQLFEYNYSQIEVWNEIRNVNIPHSTRIIRLVESYYVGLYKSPITGNPMVPIFESEPRINNTDDEILDYTTQCQESTPVIITSFINCPHIKLGPPSFSWQLNSTGIIINELHLYVDNAMFRRDAESDILICHDTFKDAVVKALSKSIYQDNAVYQADVEGIVSFSLSCISVVCLLLTLVTFMLFPALRTQPGLNNMFLSLFFIGAYLALIFKASTGSPIGCSILGGIVHFCWVLVFFWMNVCSIHMFRVFRSLGRQVPSSIHFCLTLKYLIYSVISTFVIMGINIVVSICISNGETYGYGLINNSLCYIRYPLMVLLTMALPANLIVLSNLIMFFIISLKIRESSKIQKHTQKDRNYFSIYARLSTVTGLTWLSSIPAVLSGSAVFAYIFSVLNCSQGIFIFIAFICNKRVVNLYRNMIMRRGSLTSHSSNR